MTASGYVTYTGTFGGKMFASVGISGYSGCSGISGYLPYDFRNVYPNRNPEEEQKIVLRGIPGECFQYALQVVQSRWPEGESAIRKDVYWWRTYLGINVVRKQPSKEDKQRWIREEGFTPKLFDVLNVLGDMPIEFQEFTFRLRPDLVGQIKNLDPRLKEKYQHEFELSQVDL
jgi:hypothetical protein